MPYGMRLECSENWGLAMSETEQRRVADKVREYLDRRGHNGISFEVVDEELRQEDHWWRVPIHPSAEPEKRYWYYETLAEVEEDLSEKEGISAWLVPSDPLVKEPAVAR